MVAEEIISRFFSLATEMLSLIVFFSSCNSRCVVNLETIFLFFEKWIYLSFDLDARIAFAVSHIFAFHELNSGHDNAAVIFINVYLLLTCLAAIIHFWCGWRWLGGRYIHIVAGKSNASVWLAHCDHAHNKQEKLLNRFHDGDAMFCLFIFFFKFIFYFSTNRNQNSGQTHGAHTMHTKTISKLFENLLLIFLFSSTNN